MCMHPPQVSDRELVRAADFLSGFFTRPADFGYAVDQMRALGVEHVFTDGSKVQVSCGATRYSFDTGCEPLADFIGKCLGSPEVIAAAMLLVKTAGRFDDASPHEVTQALRKVAWRGGHTPSGDDAKPGEVQAPEFADHLAADYVPATSPRSAG